MAVSVTARKTSGVVRKPRDTLLSSTLHFGPRAIGHTLPLCFFFILSCIISELV